MRISTFSTAFVALVASAVTAAPVASNEGEVLQARNAEGEIEARSSDIGLYFCKAFGFTGGCLYQRWQYNVCYNVPDGWNDVISSVGPDAGEGGCYFFPAYNCATVSSPSGSLYVTNPGYSELSGGVGLWNDVISSFICY